MNKQIIFTENQIKEAKRVAKSLGLSFSAFVRLSMSEKINRMMQTENTHQSYDQNAPRATQTPR
ncbi:MAG: hypothetical protein MPEBLZ_02046 [Candidatus Methanoperedens nitroreducens]|uniref:Ribbon-helix-helix protein, copG family n=1 Tax=Candidatus Methanoperedens nitratireducens TaxID=1392998 RepID=A0A0P7ZHZ1_9EURY|nr:MAG: hypothetical protein MPEBLZ_02046 [Candidatus Methanoperedens sp. BLZ1]